MAGVSTKEIKNRIRSMESTKQITKAMEMVAASKLRRAQTQIANSRPYFDILYSTIQDLLRITKDLSSPYIKKREVRMSWNCMAVFSGITAHPAENFTPQNLLNTVRIFRRVIVAGL